MYQERIEPNYQSPWPRKEDARSPSESISVLETKAFLLAQDPDPLDIPDLIDTFKRLKTLKSISK